MFKSGPYGKRPKIIGYRKEVINGQEVHVKIYEPAGVATTVQTNRDSRHGLCRNISAFVAAAEIVDRNRLKTAVSKRTVKFESGNAITQPRGAGAK